MFGDDLRVVANQPLTSDRKSTKPFAFLDARHLQQLQTTTSRTNKNKLCAGCNAPPIVRTNVYIPAASHPFQSDNAMSGCNSTVGLLRQPMNQLSRNLAEVDVGSTVHSGRRNGCRFATTHQQRGPFLHAMRVAGKLHRLEKMMRSQPIKSSLEVVHLLFSMDKAQVRNRVDKLAWLIHHPCPNSITPKEFRLFELLKDLDRIGDINRAIVFLERSVAQFANSCVPGACVVPCVRTFLCKLIGNFKQLDLQVRF